MNTKDYIVVKSYLLILLLLGCTTSQTFNLDKWLSKTQQQQDHALAKLFLTEEEYTLWSVEYAKRQKLDSKRD